MPPPDPSQARPAARLARYVPRPLPGPYLLTRDLTDDPTEDTRFWTRGMGRRRPRKPNGADCAGREPGCPKKPDEGKLCAVARTESIATTGGQRSGPSSEATN